jgi:hypothetical protein
MVFPSKIPKNQPLSNQKHPVLYMKASKKAKVDLGLDYYEGFTLLLQELSIDLSDVALIKMADLFTQSYPEDAIEPQSLDLLYVKSVDEHLSDEMTQSKLYFERFLLQPVQINLSFTATHSMHDA